MEDTSNPDNDPLFQDFDMAVNYTDYQNIPYMGGIKILPLYEIVLKSYIYAMIIFFSLVGNTLIIIVVLRHKQMRTTTNFYIVNLAVADILVTLFCTWVHLVNNINDNHWVLGSFFCKFNTFCQVFCLIASVLSLTLIAYDRFFGIVFALKAHMSNRKARFSIGVIWLASFIIAAPLLWFRELKVRYWADYTERWCDDTWPVVHEVINGTNITIASMPARTIYFTFISAVLYFFPMIVMTLAYSIIILKLRSTTMPGERVDAGFATQQKTKRKVIAMLVTILAVFGICWLPYQIVLLYSELRKTRDTLGEWYFTMQFLAGCFAYSNSALNPLIYAGFNKNFKQALLNMKSGLDTTRRMSYTASARRFSFPDLRRRSKSTDSYMRVTSSSKSTTSLSSRDKVILRGLNSVSPTSKRGMSVDSSPIMFFIKDSPNYSPDIKRSPMFSKPAETFKMELERNIMSWQPKTSPEISKVGIARTISFPARRNTERKTRFMCDDDASVLEPLRRHSLETPPPIL